MDSLVKLNLDFSRYSGKTLLKQWWPVVKQHFTQVQDTINQNDTALNNEATARQNADKTLQTNIDSEAASRKTADNTLQKNIDSEATTRQNADSNLQKNIDSEATTRQNADSNLQKNIDSEAAARQNADDTLQASINSEVLSRKSAINGEITARQNADSLLQNNIDKLNSALDRKADKMHTHAMSDVNGLDEILDAYKVKSWNDIASLIVVTEQMDNYGDREYDGYTFVSGRAKSVWGTDITVKPVNSQQEHWDHLASSHLVAYCLLENGIINVYIANDLVDGAKEIALGEECVVITTGSIGTIPDGSITIEKLAPSTKEALKGAKGDKGDTGDTGAPGDAGIPGCNASTIVVASSTSRNKTQADYTCSGTNDHTAINNAIAALPSTGGKILLLEGTYNIGGAINVNKSNVTIEGMGTGTVLNRAFDNGKIVNATGNNVTITRLRITGNSGTYPSTGNYGIYVDKSKGITIEFVTISDESNGIHLHQPTFVKVVQCNITDCTNGIYCDYVFDSLLAFNTIDTMTEAGIYADWGSSRNDVFKNQIISAAVYGISATRNGEIAKYNRISENTCRDCGTGVNVAGQYNKVHDNYVIRGTGQTSDYSSSQHTIYVDSRATYNDVSDNYIFGKNYINNGGSTNTFSNNRYA